MSVEPVEIGDELLSVAADGELTVAEQAAFAAAAAADPSLQQRVERLILLKSTVRRAVLSHPYPEGLDARVGALLDRVEREPADQPAAPATPLWQRFRWLVPTAAVAAAAVLGLVIFGPGRHGAPSAADQPGDATQVAQVWDFTPDHLASVHTYWHDYFRRNPHPPMSPDKMAQSLTVKVGYPVRPPNVSALQARLVACTACDHAFPSQHPAALFLMQRSNGNELTLFEVTAPRDAVMVHDFRPSGSNGVETAESNGVNLALLTADDLSTCLASSTASVDELAHMVPCAVRMSEGVSTAAFARR